MSVLVISNPTPTPFDILVNGNLESQLPVNSSSVDITLTDGVNPVVPSNITAALGAVEIQVTSSITYDVYVNNTFQETATVSSDDNINITVG